MKVVRMSNVVTESRVKNDPSRSFSWYKLYRPGRGVQKGPVSVSIGSTSLITNSESSEENP